MSRDLHWSLVVTRSPQLDGEGKITIERTSIQRLVKQAFDAGAESAAREYTNKNQQADGPLEELQKLFGMK
jgi:hypothetical protein